MLSKSGMVPGESPVTALLVRFMKHLAEHEVGQPGRTRRPASQHAG